MNSAVQRYIDAASGLTELTRSKAEQIVKQLVRSGEAAGDQVGELVEDLVERQRQNREAISSLVRNETTKAVRSMGLATNEEVERLQKQVADLKREVQHLEGAAGGAAAPAKKATAKKATKKTTAATTAGSTGNVVVASKVKEAVKSSGVRMSGDFPEALNAEVAAVIDKAVKRAQDNGRSTVRPSDL